MSKLLEELAADFEAKRPPKDAVTVRAFAEKVGITMTMARNELARYEAEEGWTSTLYMGKRYYWKL